jgi:hypothetical protein
MTPLGNNIDPETQAIRISFVVSANIRRTRNLPAQQMVISIM